MSMRNHMMKGSVFALIKFVVCSQILGFKVPYNNMAPSCIKIYLKVSICFTRITQKHVFVHVRFHSKRVFYVNDLDLCIKFQYNHNSNMSLAQKVNVSLYFYN